MLSFTGATTPPISFRDLNQSEAKPLPKQAFQTAIIPMLLMANPFTLVLPW